MHWQIATINLEIAQIGLARVAINSFSKEPHGIFQEISLLFPSGQHSTKEGNKFCQSPIVTKLHSNTVKPFTPYYVYTKMWPEALQ